jgi:hypothetical protein
MNERSSFGLSLKTMWGYIGLPIGGDPEEDDDEVVV